VAAGAVLAMLAGFFPVRIPRTKNSFAAGEIFMFLLLLMHGPEAAALAAPEKPASAPCAPPRAGAAASPARRWPAWPCSPWAGC
jgi:hypothetical protein